MYPFEFCRYYHIACVCYQDRSLQFTTKLTLHHHRGDPEFIEYRDERFFYHGDSFDDYLNLRSPQTSRGTPIYDTLLKEKWAEPCTVSVISWFLLIWSTFTRDKSDRKWRPAAIPGAKQSSFS